MNRYIYTHVTSQVELTIGKGKKNKKTKTKQKCNPKDSSFYKRVVCTKFYNYVFILKSMYFIYQIKQIVNN